MCNDVLPCSSQSGRMVKQQQQQQNNNKIRTSCCRFLRKANVLAPLGIDSLFKRMSSRLATATDSRHCAPIAANKTSMLHTMSKRYTSSGCSMRDQNGGTMIAINKIYNRKYWRCVCLVFIYRWNWSQTDSDRPGNNGTICIRTFDGTH